MSAEAIAIVGALLGAMLTMIILISIRLYELRERVGKLEEWVRVRERLNNIHKG